MADVKWIKIVTDIFDDEKILLIESMPEADAIIVIWFKLLTLAGKINNGGVLLMNDKLPYTDEMLATIFRRPINTVRLALNTFEKFEMVEIINNAITIPNWSKHQSLDKLEQRNEYMKKYMKEYREKQKLIADGKACKLNSKVNGKVNSKVNVSEAEEDIDKELDKDKERDIDKELDKDREKKKPHKHKYGEYKNVLLTDIQLEKLKNEFPNDWETRIERVSEYCESTGKSYKNYLATIRAWARKEKSKKKINTAKPKTYDDNPFSNPELMDKMMAEWKEEQRRAGTLDE